MTATETAVRLAQIAGHAAADKLATDIVLIDVSDRLAITDVFVIASGNNERQVEAIVDEIEEKLRLVGSKPLRREGKRDGRWVLLDYADIVVHVQHVEERVFYSLERLWQDCPAIEFDPMAAGPSVPSAVGPAAVEGHETHADADQHDADQHDAAGADEA
ncbi:MAG TPA: ribosome silencing factor [Jatrophihabitans sp.]|nr:ribosome silencing factor [Jatrophihabitans sp.]